MKTLMMRGLVVMVLASVSCFAVSCSDTSTTEPSQTVSNHKLTYSEEQIIFKGDNQTDVTIYNVDLGFADGTSQAVDLPPGITKFIIPTDLTRVTINGMALAQGASMPIFAGGKQVYVRWTGNIIVVTDMLEVY